MLNFETTNVESFHVEVSDTQCHLTIDPNWIKQVVRHTLVAEHVSAATISITMTDNASIRVINCRHLGHDWATDVISFLLSDPGVNTELAGELVVSVEMAVDTAGEAGFSIWSELTLYLVHGLLHLCGYDDHVEADVVAIRAREEAILGRLATLDLVSGLTPTPATSDHSGRESVRWPR